MGGAVDRTLRAAARYVTSGDEVAAATLLSNCIETYPKNAELRAALAELNRSAVTQIDRLLEMRRFDEAIAASARHLSERPQSLPFLIRLAAALEGLGRYGDANDIFVAAAHEAPEDAEVLMRVGVTACLADRHDAGIAALERAISLGCGTDGHLVLGYALFNRGEFAQALCVFHSGLAISSQVPELQMGLAETLHALGHLVDAAAAYEAVLLAQPANLKAWTKLGQVQLDLGQAHPAMKAFAHALDLDPENSAVRAQRAIALRAVGDFEAAATEQRRVLSKDPIASACALSFVSLARQNEHDELCTRFERILGDTATLDEDKVNAHYGLAQIAIRQNEPALAVAQLDAAAAPYARLPMRQMHGQDTVLASICKVFDTNPPRATSNDAPFRPVFIVGMPRSGTTLIDQMLTAHPMVKGVGESEALTLAIQQSGGLDGMPDQAQIDDIRSCYFGHLTQRLEHSAPFVTDKMPVNFRFIGIIAAAFPEAAIVHVDRVAEAVCWSCFRTRFTSLGMGFTYSQETLGAFYRGYVSMMAHWEALQPGHVRTMSYDALIQTPEDQMRRLLTDLELPWDDAVLSFEQNERLVRTASAAQVRRKIYSGSSDVWRAFAPELGPLLRAIGSGFQIDPTG